MRKLYFLLVVCCLKVAAFAQTSTTIYATGASGSFISGNGTSSVRTDGDIVTTSTTKRGYGVFDLSSIPVGSAINSVTLGYNTATVSGSGTASGASIRGYAGNLSTVTDPPTLFSDMGSGTSLSTSNYSTSTGAKTVTLNTGTDLSFFAANTGTAISICWTGGNGRTITITGETGTSATTGTHAPYLLINYTPPCSGTPAPGNTISSAASVCPGLTTTLSLQNTTPGAGVTYQWLSAPDVSGAPGAFALVPGANSATYTPTVSATTWYECTVTCSFVSTTSTPVQVSALVLPPAISGSSSICNGQNVTLSDATTGGTWASDNTATATVGTSGVVSGVATGTVNITYTAPNGCTTSASETVTPAPTAITITPSTAFPLCAGTSGSPVATATRPEVILVNQDFNSGMTGAIGGTWTIVNTGDASPYNWSIVDAPGNAYIFGDGTPRMEAYPDGTDEFTTLITSFISPSFSTVGFDAVNVSFNYNVFSDEFYDAAAEIDYSTDGGATWSLVHDYLNALEGSYYWTEGTPDQTLTLPAGALNQPNVQLRWYYNSNFGFYWQVDNIVVSAPAGPLPSDAYTWTGVSGATGLSCTNCSSPVVSPATPGANIYSVSATYLGCTTYSGINITVNVPATILGGSAPICQGTSATTLTDAVTGGTWNSASPAIATINLNTGLVTGLAPGTSVITYTLPPGCTITTTVTINPAPNVASFIGTAANGCAGSDAVVTLGSTSLLNQTYNLVYDLSGANTATANSTTVTISGTSGTFNTPPLANTGATTITLTSITNSLGCSSPLTFGNVSTFMINPLPSPISGANVACGGISNTLSDAGGGTWTSSNTAVATVGATSGIVTTVAAGTSTITYTLLGCTATLPYTVNITPPITGIPGACIGGTATLSDIAPGGIWSSTNTAVATIGSSSGILTGVSFGSALISYTLPSTGCAATVVALTTSTPAIYTVTGGGNFCPGGSFHVGLANSSVDVGYQLYFAGVPVGSVIPGTGGALDFGIQTAPGSYTVIANPGTSCATTMGSVAASMLPAPALFTVSGGGTSCAGGSGFHILLSGSSVGVSYQLYNGVTVTGAPVAGTGTTLDMGVQTAAGTYTVIATTTATGCIATMTGSATIMLNPLPVINSVTGTGSYCVGGTGVAVGLNGSTAGISYQLYLNGVASGSPVISTGGIFSFGLKTLAGTYTVIATNTTTGCTSNMAGSAIITINPLPSLFNVTGGGSYCAGGTGVHVGLNGSTPGVSYRVYTDGVPAAPTLVGTGTSLDFGLHVLSGVRTVIATSPSGCTSTMLGSATVSISPAPAAFNVTGGGSFCAGGTGVHVGLNGSVAGTTYQVYNGTTLIDAAVGAGSTIDFGLQTIAGTYTVLATNAITACSVNMLSSVTVTVNPLPTAFNVIGGGNYCTGGIGVNVVLNSSTSGISYQLLLGGVAVGSPVVSAGGSINFGLQTATGTYTVLATNLVTGCMKTMTGSVAVGLNPLPFPHTVTGGGSYCIGGTGVHVNLNGSETGINYQLYNGTPMGAVHPGTGATLDFGLQTATGTYTIIATNSITACTVNMLSSVTVTTNPLPAVYSVTGGGAYCTGGTGVHVLLSNSVSGTNYQLLIEGAAVGSAVPGTGFPLDFGLRTAPGIYTVVATNTATTCTANMTGSATIAISTPPTAFTVTGGGTYCVGGTGVHVGLSSSAAGVNYQLYLGGSALGTPIAGTGSALDFGTQTATGTYTVMATGALTVCTVAMTGSATVGTTPLPLVYSVTGGGSYCFGGAGLPVGLSGSAIGINYQLWSGGFPIGAAQPGIGSAISFGIQTAAGAYTVVASNAGTGCISNMTGSAIITINPLPSLHALTGGGSYCTGGAGIHIGLNGSDAGVNYQLMSGITSIGAPASGTGAAIDLGLQTLTGTYTVVATNAATGCANNMTGIVSVSLYPLPVVYNVIGGGHFCSGGTGAHIGLSGSNAGITYQLFNGMTPLTILSGTGLPIDFGLQTAPGSYTVVATNSTTLCNSNMSGSATVVVDPLPVVHAVTGGGNYCTGGTGVHIGLNGSDTGNTYELYYGASTVGLPLAGTGSALDLGAHLAAGTYTIKAFSAAGCESDMAGNAVIAVNPLPVAYTVSGGGNYCAGGSGAHVGLSSSSTSVTYQLYVGVIASGSPVPGTGAALDFGFQTIAGTYTVVATNDTTFCTKTMNGSAIISISALPFAYTVTGGGNYCTGGTGVHVGLSGSDMGMSYQLQFDGTNTGSPVAGTGGSIDFGLQTATGPYTVVATNTATGCTNNMSGNVTVSFNTLPTVYTLTSTSSYYCIGGSGVDLILSGSDAGSTYQVYLGGVPSGLPIPGTGALLNLGLYTAGGTYTVIGSNSASCVTNMAGSATVTVNLPPVIYSVIGGGSYCAGGDGVHIGLSGSTNNISYQLYNGIAAVGSPVIGTGAPLDFGLHTAAGSYSIIATNGVTTCVSTMSGTTTIVINPLPAVSTLTGGGSYCAGSTGVNVGLNGSQGGITYQLSAGASPLTTMPGTGSALNFGLQTMAGSYSIAATNTVTGCTNNMAGSATVVINSLPTAYVVTGGGNYCPGTAGVHVGLVGSSAGIIYQLYSGAAAVGSPVPGTGSAIDFGLQSLPGSYTVTATNPATTCTNQMTGTVMVGVNAAPTAYGVVGGGNYCVGGTGVSVGLANSTAGVSYQLYYGGIPSGAPVTGTDAAIDFGLQTGIGNYTVVASNMLTTCSDNMLGSVTVGTSPLVAPAVTLSTGLSDVLCSGTLVSVSALATNGGSEPIFHWYLNGVPTPYTGSTYTLTPVNGDSISVMLTSSEACATPATVNGGLDRLTVLAHGLPAVSITDVPGDHVCQGATVIFTAATAFGGDAPSLSWKVNGISEGIDSTYSYIPGEGDNVTCTLVSNYQCRLANSATSNDILMRVDPSIVPSVSITAHPGAYIAPGENTLLTAVDANNAVSPTYQWYVNGVPVPGATVSTYFSSNFSDLDSISCVETSGGYCAGMQGAGSIIIHFGKVGVAQIASAGSDISLVPNPNKGTFIIKGTLGTTADEQVSLEITDMLGQVIYKDNVTAHGGNLNERIQLSSTVANGMYILNLRSGATSNVFHVVIEQ